MMSPDGTVGKKGCGGIIVSLSTIDSAIRNGHFLYAYRETNKLFSEVSRGEYDTEHDLGELLSSIRMTVLFLKPIIRAYAQNQASLDIARRTMKCKAKPTAP